MRQLHRTPVIADFSREDPAHPGLQLTLSPGLIEESEAESLAAIADGDFEDRTCSRAHRAFSHRHDFSDDGDALVNGELREFGQFAAQGVPAGIVREQVPDGEQTQPLCNGIGGAGTEGATQTGIECQGLGCGIHSSRVPAGYDREYRLRLRAI